MKAQFNLDREQDKMLYTSAGPPNVEFHFHSHIELMAVQRGAVEVTVNDRQELLRAGELAVALSYDAHSFRSTESAWALAIVIPTQLCPEFAAAARNQKVRNPFIREEALYQKVCDCYQQIKMCTNEISRKGYLYVILGALLEYMELETQVQQPNSQLLTDVLLYLNDHYSEDISLSDVATALGYNASYLSGAFKKRFHVSMSAYITMLRLRRAVLLMHDPEKSITDCCFESGFQSLRTFYRVFEAEFRCSPKLYRQTRL
jgi:AraC-like DNA-binding protein